MNTDTKTKCNSCGNIINNPEKLHCGQCESKALGDRLWSIVIKLIFGTLAAAFVYRFIEDTLQNGIIQAIKNKPAMLVITGLLATFYIIGAKEEMEKWGLGGVRNGFIKLLLAAGALILLSIIISIFGDILGSGSGVPSNARM